MVDATKSKIFEILSELYQKSVFIYESYFEGWQLAEQLSKDINFNQNPVEIKPLLYDDPSLLKNQSKLTEMLNILKLKLEKMEVEAEVSKY